MSFSNELPPSSSAKPPGTTACSLGGAAAAADYSVPLHNLSTVQSKMDNLQKYLTDSVNRNALISKDQMDLVSSEIASAIHQTIVNGAALLACAQNPNTSSHQSIAKGRVDQSPDFRQLAKGKLVDQKVEVNEDEDGEDYEVIEIDSVELLAEHIHFCDICGKGFKRDANLRMHMRAHGNQFKTPEALAKPDSGGGASIGGEIKKTRFSCPYVGCNRNQKHKKFRPLKSVICVKNHFKRSHCPKMYSCNRCNKKSFSVVADLKSHLKHCGETKWKCSCGTSFSRKDKLFGHMALFEGHMPAVVDQEEEETAVLVVEDDEEEDNSNLAARKQMEIDHNEAGSSSEFFDGFGSVDNYYFQDLLGSPNAAPTNHEFDGFYNF